MTLDGHGHTLRQGCFEKRLLRQDGTGFVELRNVTLTRGGSDGPGAAVTTRGEIRVVDSKVQQNLAEEPGGGIMSQRRATIVRSVITGNLANDDGGGVYARRGGIQVYDSIVSGNLVDGSGGALGSTGDILVVRSHIDGNTTDGDGGAIYADEDGDVTVIDSTVNGSTADGPGGAIFTLDGDVTVINSTLNGNRADDRGGAISGEAAVTVINSTIARNLAVAHVGGGHLGARRPVRRQLDDQQQLRRGQGRRLLAAGVAHASSTPRSTDNIAPVGRERRRGRAARGVRLGHRPGEDRQATAARRSRPTTNCEAPAATSFGYNVVSDASCGLDEPATCAACARRSGRSLDNGGRGETRLPLPGSPALDRIPAAACALAPLPQLEGEQHCRPSPDRGRCWPPTSAASRARRAAAATPAPSRSRDEAQHARLVRARRRGGAGRRRRPRAAGEDSPWPRTDALRGARARGARRCCAISSARSS